MTKKDYDSIIIKFDEIFDLLDKKNKKDYLKDDEKSELVSNTSYLIELLDDHGISNIWVESEEVNKCLIGAKIHSK
tara:strand:- start:962 stop:1189 length:228 start_codon:yes stop_codon:yes gene_type:complete